MDYNNSCFGINPLRAYSLINESLSSTISSSSCSKDIDGFDEYPLEPETMSLYTADANFE